MSLHEDLLKQARHLAGKDKRRPSQASLRRAVSAAYYALFHLLVREASRFVVRGKAREPLRAAVARAFSHTEMKQAARAFASGAPPRVFQAAAGSVPKDLAGIAEVFVDLQQARHEADYDLARNFTRREALDLVERVEWAFEAWRRVRDTEEAKAFLLALLLHQRLGRR